MTPVYVAHYLGFDYSFSSAYILKALHNPNLYHEGGAYRQLQGSPAYKYKRDLFSDVSTSRSAGLRIAPRSFGPGDLRFPPLIPHEKTAPSDSAAFDKLRPRASRGELVAGRQSLPKSPALFRVRMGQEELRL